jgi:hypothetical protein
MTEIDAREELERDTDAASEPMLDAGDIDQLLSSFVVTAASSASAADGRWSLNRAKAAGWRRKAGRYATRIDFSADGRSFKASQSPEFCLKMAESFDRLADQAGEPGGANGVGVAAYAGGISASDKLSRASNADRVRPAFTRTLHVEESVADELTRT